jgi:predicted GNAT family N-acyltransferase
VQIRIFRQGDPNYLLSLLLRYKILRIPLSLTFSSHDLAKDKNDIHIGIFDGEAIVATLTLTDMGDGTVKMRQVAVDDTIQGKGFGKTLVAFADSYARDKGYKLIHCHARDTAKPFYLKLGYTVAGDEFQEVGIKHYYMKKKL